MNQQIYSSMMQYIPNKKHHRCGIKFCGSSSKYCLNYRDTKIENYNDEAKKARSLL